MHTKNDRRPLPALPLGPNASAKPAENTPARGLSAVLEAALGGAPGKAQFPVGKPIGSPSRPEKLDKAPKPLPGGVRTRTPRTGHR